MITFLNIFNQFFFLFGCKYLPFCGRASFEIPASKLYIEVQIKIPNTDKFSFKGSFINNKNINLKKLKIFEENSVDTKEVSTLLVLFAH